ncbi:P-loop containing nucleoside triphosphate hydrolase protein [Diplogelasinospora grovesii]|uniref:P-loop containing nucleoside triphosphate hydrolase protein n=1 Tax=Diplogelasinospora grovesii TaxID=303347 RepID=A0AAN6S6Y1_9PEZI|nr:P-loop containing nucleoside triphosphate hydrolase protein [Diplogelasinospora grovesii]
MYKDGLHAVTAVNTEAAFEQAYTDIVRKLKIKRGNDQDIKEFIRQYLSSEAANSRTLKGLNRYLPQSANGRTVFTTRSRDIAIKVAKETVKLNEFSLSKAERLLKKLMTRKDLTNDAASVTKLLHELTCLPLTITQAAAYLERNEVSIVEYLRLLRNTEKDIADLLSEELLNRTRFEKIRDIDRNAADILSFMSQIEPKSILQSLLPELSLKMQTVSAIGTLCGYAFMSKRDEMLNIHSLVHLATRIWLSREGLETQATKTAMRYLAGSFPTNEYENRHIWRTYLPHALRILMLAVGEPALRGGTPWSTGIEHELVRAYESDGQIRKAVALLKQVVAVQERMLAEDHPDRLASQHELARAYESGGQIRKAVALLEQVVAVRERTLAEDHPDRLASQHALAGAYHADGQIKKAVTLFEQVVTVKEKTLAEEHPNRLASQHELAGAYQADGQIKKAVALLEQVVAVEERTLAEDHPSRLASQHALVGAYKSNGQIKKAVALFEQVVAVRERTLAEEHPDRLVSQYNLAIAYQADAQMPQAVELLKHVTAVESRSLQEDHPDRLASLSALENALEVASQ